MLEYAKRFFAEKNAAAGQEHPESLSGGQFFIAGIGAGLMNGAVSGPVEHIRIRKSNPSRAPSTHPHSFPRLTDAISYEPLIRRTLGRGKKNLLGTRDRRNL